MDLMQLRCFTAVASELNFSRAAQRLNMTQPPLSRQVQLLEHQLGVELFTRSTRSVALTAAGQAFFIEAQDLLKRAEQAVLSAKRFADGDIGSVAVSFVPSAVYEFLPRVIADTKKHLPDIRVSLSEMNSYEQHEALRSRRIDIGIVRAALRQPDVASECLIREPFVLALPSEHRLASAAVIRLQDLHDQPFIMYSHSAYQPFNELLSGMFRCAQVEPDIIQWLGSTITILALINSAMGFALVPRSAMRIRFEAVVFREIELPEGVNSELHLIWRKDNCNPAFVKMLEAIRDAVPR